MQEHYINETVEKSKTYFNSGYGCAESVLMALAEAKGIQSALFPRIASGFCGGVANTGGMCGAVIAGIMAINIIYGRDKATESKEANYQKVKKFVKEFDVKFGSVNCPQLTGCDLGTAEGHAKFKELNVHKKCTDFTAEATRLVLEII
ncbi:MAG: C-GCAxxG-C-C family protein [Bacteroidales bacterium]